MAVKMKIDGKLVEVGGGASAPVITQDALGIYINDTALQDATEDQDGLMTKEQVKKLNETDPTALPKTGGAMTGYLADKTALQVRNVMTATEKPADTVGMDGDVCMVPGASGGSSGGGSGVQVLDLSPVEVYKKVQPGDNVSWYVEGAFGSGSCCGGVCLRKGDGTSSVLISGYAGDGLGNGGSLGLIYANGQVAYKSGLGTSENSLIAPSTIRLIHFG